MKGKKQRRPISRFIIIAAMATPLLLGLARVDTGLIGIAGERAAIISAAIIMPDGGWDILRERFQNELYGEYVLENGEYGEENEEHPPIENERPRFEEIPDEPEPPPPESSGSGTSRPPKIPKKYAAEIVSEDFSGKDGGTLIPYGAGFIKNDTKKSPEDIEQILEESFELDFTGGEPQVLIFHTHATESFEKYDSDVYDTRNTWRSTDNNNNMAAVGGAMQQALEDNGIGVIHDTTQHDYPSYNGSYERSAKTVMEYLEEYPTIKVVLDLHRDAMERENQTIVKPTAVIEGKKAAQVMIIAGGDDGTMDMPEWRRNLRFAAAFQDAVEQRYPGLMRPVYFCYRKYNMDLSDGSLLLEFGSNANTLDEAIYSAQMVGEVLADLIKEHTTQ